MTTTTAAFAKAVADVAALYVAKGYSDEAALTAAIPAVVNFTVEAGRGDLLEQIAL